MPLTSTKQLELSADLASQYSILESMLKELPSINTDTSRLYFETAERIAAEFRRLEDNVPATLVDQLASTVHDFENLLAGKGSHSILFSLSPIQRTTSLPIP